MIYCVWGLILEWDHFWNYQLTQADNSFVFFFSFPFPLLLLLLSLSLAYACAPFLRPGKVCRGQTGIKSSRGVRCVCEMDDGGCVVCPCGNFFLPAPFSPSFSPFHFIFHFVILLHSYLSVLSPSFQCNPSHLHCSVPKR
jgi:hypothetical protein